MKRMIATAAALAWLANPASAQSLRSGSNGGTLYDLPPASVAQ
jgi:hypothetical protein